MEIFGQERKYKSYDARGAAGPSLVGGLIDLLNNSENLCALACSFLAASNACLFFTFSLDSLDACMLLVSASLYNFSPASSSVRSV